jgi:CubicO group peptidase (beta-lactamase class C family)
VENSSRATKASGQVLIRRLFFKHSSVFCGRASRAETGLIFSRNDLGLRASRAGARFAQPFRRVRPVCGASGLKEKSMQTTRRLACVSVLSASVILRPSAASAQKADLRDLDAFVARALKEYQVPGAAIAVVQDGKVVLAKGYGVRDVTKPGAVDANTIFQLASVTKSLTAAAAATVVDEGKLDWDIPIFNYLPEFVGYDPYMTRWLTERDLLAMRTGWPEFQGDMLDSFGYNRGEILRRLRYFKPRYSLRDVAQYSNPGLFVAGEVAGRAANLSWNDLVEDRLLRPLAMTRSGTVVKGLRDSNRSAAHALIGGKPQVVDPTILDTTGAASSGTSTASDMAKFMQLLLNKGTHNGNHILKPETVAEMFRRSMVSKVGFSELPPISETTGFFYGLGVDSYDYAGRQVIEKAGALAGVRTVVTLVPAANAGIFVAANLNLTTFPEAVRARFLNQLFGIDLETDQKAILALSAQIAKLVAPPPAPTDPGKFVGTRESLVGSYENDYYGHCEILLDGAALKVECGPAKYPATLKHWNNGAFVMQFPGATQAPTLTTFAIGADGKAESFTHEEMGTFMRVQERE